MFNGLFDLQIRLDRLDKNTDPLSKLDQIIDWELFRPTLDTLGHKPRKSNAGWGIAHTFNEREREAIHCRHGRNKATIPVRKSVVGLNMSSACSR